MEPSQGGGTAISRHRSKAAGAGVVETSKRSMSARSTKARSSCRQEPLSGALVALPTRSNRRGSPRVGELGRIEYGSLWPAGERPALLKLAAIPWPQPNAGEDVLLTGPIQQRAAALTCSQNRPKYHAVLTDKTSISRKHAAGCCCFYSEIKGQLRTTRMGMARQFDCVCR